MSCIIGITHRNKIYIAGDSCSSSDDFTIRTISRPKVFRNRDLIIGFAGSFRAGYALMPNIWTPPSNIESIDQIAEHIRTHLDSMSINLSEDGQATCPSVYLIGWNKNVYTLWSDFHISCYTEKFVSIGVGSDFAYGSLYETQDLKISVIDKINRALDCASHFCSAVKPPYVIERG